MTQSRPSRALDAGEVDLSDGDLRASSRAPTSCTACVRWQLAKRRSRHAQDVKNRAEIHRTGKKMYKQKGTGSRPPRLRVVPTSSAVVAAPSARRCAATPHDLPKKVRKPSV